MALLSCRIFSESIRQCTTVQVILPQAVQHRIGMDSPDTHDSLRVLYLLHGLSDDDSIWLRRTSIERYAAEAGIAVVMPNVHRSFYCNVRSGENYWDYVSKELPEICRNFFPISHRRADTFVAGLSMGGYGAFKLALNCPEQFAAAASLSGSLRLDWEDWRGHPLENEDGRRLVENMFGSAEEYADSENNLRRAIDRLSASEAAPPRLYQCCGTEDFLIEDNRKFNVYAAGKFDSLTYEESPGAHTWDYWDAQIQRVLEWLDL